MSAVKTRRQTAAASPAIRSDAQVVLNGVNRAAHKLAETEYPRENIFLFIPNVIGTLLKLYIQGSLLTRT